MDEMYQFESNVFFIDHSVQKENNYLWAWEEIIIYSAQDNDWPLG